MSDALNRAGFGAADEVDGLETHDCFTVTEYMAIDHSGLTKPGESWKAVEAVVLLLMVIFRSMPAGD